jgi:hypothetical protein
MRDELEVGLYVLPTEWGRPIYHPEGKRLSGRRKHE